MGPTCKHVAALIGNVLKASQIDIHRWLNLMHQYGLAPLKPQGSKKRYDMVSHGRPHSNRESSLEQDAASYTITLRVKERTKCGIHRKGKPRKEAPRLARRRKGEEAKRRPSHIGRAGLREDPLQHFSRNTRNTQVRCNKGNQLSTSKGGKFEHRFSYPVSSIFNAEDL